MNLAIARRSAVLLFLALATCPMLSSAQTCPADRTEGLGGVPAQRLRLVFSSQPSTTPVSAVISPAVAVGVFDECNQPVRGKSVQISLGPHPPNPAILSGTLAVRATGPNGAARFADLRLDYLGHGYTLVATVSDEQGTFSAVSAPFDETRVGDPCLGPNPACSSGCADRDGDGLNDAWEIAGGIDINGDGKIDAQHDVLLPGADPNKPDIFVQYDWMGYGDEQNACSADAECPALWGTGGHAAETCSGPPVPGSAHSCAYACTIDTDCTSRGPAGAQASHVGERCLQNRCMHTHDPLVVAPGALDAVVERFALRGFNLHLVRGRELPHSHVLSYRLLNDALHPENTMINSCEGGSLATGTAGPGQYTESFYDLKTTNFPPKLAPAYHYVIFGHYNTCDTDAHCGNCPAPSIALNPDGSPKAATPLFGGSGLAEIEGNDAMVSLGPIINDRGAPPSIFNVGGAFMHELGHNLGLHHGGGSSVTGDAEDSPTFKPNYISVMNYKYNLSGILRGAAVGSIRPTGCKIDADCLAGEHCGRGGYCGRLDYSTQTLPTGGNTPGSLTEAGIGLDETAGLGSGNADIITFSSFNAATNTCPLNIAPSQGPIDWDSNGIAGDNMHVNTDLNRQDHPSVTACPTGVTQTLKGHTDWGPAPGQSVFTYRFQCTPPGKD